MSSALSQGKLSQLLGEGKTCLEARDNAINGGVTVTALFHEYLFLLPFFFLISLVTR